MIVVGGSRPISTLCTEREKQEKSASQHPIFERRDSLAQCVTLYADSSNRLPHRRRRTNPKIASCSPLFSFQKQKHRQKTQKEERGRLRSARHSGQATPNAAVCLLERVCLLCMCVCLTGPSHERSESFERRQLSIVTVRRICAHPFTVRLRASSPRRRSRWIQIWSRPSNRSAHPPASRRSCRSRGGNTTKTTQTDRETMCVRTASQKDG